MNTFLTAGRMLAEKHRSALAKAPIQAVGARSLSAVASSRREIRKLCTIRISEMSPVPRISQTVSQRVLTRNTFCQPRDPAEDSDVGHQLVHAFCTRISGPPVDPQGVTH